MRISDWSSDVCSSDLSREGSLVTQAFIAGLAGGFGRGFSANANSVFQGTNITASGKREKLSTGEILEGGVGEGMAQTGDMVSKYLIERAEQYQPVIELPTGIDVEIVFLEGVYVRNYCIRSLTRRSRLLVAAAAGLSLAGIAL